MRSTVCIAEAIELALMVRALKLLRNIFGLLWRGKQLKNGQLVAIRPYYSYDKPLLSISYGGPTQVRGLPLYC